MRNKVYRYPKYTHSSAVTATTQVCQDLFHVSHNLSKSFNNTHPEFHRLVIVGFRKATMNFDPAMLDVIHRSCTVLGNIEAECTFRKQKYILTKGELLPEQTWKEWLESGVVHALFCKAGRVVSIAYY